MLAVTIPFTILMLILYCYWVWSKCSSAFPFVLIFFIEIVWETLSIVWIDNGIYITEQLRESYTTGAALRFIILMAPFAYIFPKKLNSMLNKKNKRITYHIRCDSISFENIIWILCVLVTLYLLFDLLISGIPLFNNAIPKSKYYGYFSRLPFTNMLHSLVLPFVMLICGVRFVRFYKYSKKKYFAFFIACIILVIQILLDNKFYGLYDYAIWFSIPSLINYLKKNSIQKHKKLPWKYILIILIVVSILLSICYSQYARQYTDPLKALLNRIFSLQSHTFWGIDLKLQQNELGLNFPTLMNEIIAGIKGVPNISSDFGLGKVMYYVTSKTYADNMLNSGFLFAGSFLTVSMSYSGYILTFILSILFGYLASFVCSIFVKYLNSGDYLMTYFTFMLYRRLFEYFRVGNLSILISWKMIIFFVIFCVIYNYGNIKDNFLINKFGKDVVK